jgi:hypothetical protein
MLKTTQSKEEQTIVVSETSNEFNLLVLKTSKLPTVFLEEMKILAI